MQNKNIWLGVIGLLVLAAIFFTVRYTNMQPSTVSSTGSTTVSTTTSATSSEPTSLEDLIKSGRAKVTVTKTTTTVQKPAPSLDYAIKISPDLSPEAVTAIHSQVATLSANLKKDPRSFEDWMQLGVVAKIAGDYPRAIELWQYASYLIPNAPEPLADIGDVYGNFMKDYPKGIEYFKKAVAVAPTNPLWKQYLADMEKNATSSK